jgi:hypothetical protein
LVASGVWPDACIPYLNTHRIVGHAITVEAEEPDVDFCAQVLTPWQITVDLGRLPPGVYEAQLIISGPGGLYPSLCAEAHLLVSSARILIPIVQWDTHSAKRPD